MKPQRGRCGRAVRSRHSGARIPGAVQWVVDVSSGWLHALGPAGPQPPGGVQPEDRAPSASSYQACAADWDLPPPPRVLRLPSTPKSGVLISGLPLPWASTPYLPPTSSGLCPGGRGRS